MHQKKINVLVIGAKSKIAFEFLAQFENNKKYNIYKAYRQQIGQNESSNIFFVDLKNRDSVELFVDKLSNIQFDVVLFFASIYKEDTTINKGLLRQYQEDISINVLSFSYICKNLNLSNYSKIIAFGDAGIDHPKKGFSSYTISKLILEGLVKILAVELSPNTLVNLICLGPTLTANPENINYYNRSLLKIKTPYKGLVSLIKFMICESDLNITGSMIEYDGGAYLIRAK